MEPRETGSEYIAPATARTRKACAKRKNSSNTSKDAHLRTYTCVCRGEGSRCGEV